MTAFDVAFWVLAIVAVIGALLVVAVKDVFRAALCLIVCFMAVAGIYVTLNADFLAAVQILVYVGAVAILIILGIVLTKEVQKGSLSNRFRVPALFVSAAFLGLGLFAINRTSWRVSDVAPVTPTTGVLATRLFGDNGYILVVEIASLLLLAAIIGAIVVVREK